MGDIVDSMFQFMSDPFIDGLEHYDRNYPKEDSDSVPVTKTKTCRCCGETGLKWMEHNGKWRLGNKTLHVCPVNPLTEQVKIT